MDLEQGWGHTIECGDVESAFSDGSCDHVIEGEIKMGGQEHFYLEPQGSVVIPLENDEMVVISSTQVGCIILQLSMHLTPFCESNTLFGSLIVRDWPIPQA